MAAPGGPNTTESRRTQFAEIGGWALTDVPGGRDALTEMVASEFRDLVDGLEPLSAPALSFMQTSTGYGGSTLEVWATGVRIHAADGRLAGTVLLYKPVVGMATLGAVAAKGDLDHFARMLGVSQPARRPAAILFADLEASSGLARRLSTAGYFAVGRRFVVAADRCIVDGGGLVGRHVGDGVGAFFLAETAGSESAAARACIAAARDLQQAMAGVAARSQLEQSDAVLRFGLHWGATAVCRLDHHDRTQRGDGARRRGQRGRTYRGMRIRRTDARVEDSHRAPQSGRRGGARHQPRPRDLHARGRSADGDREGPTRRAGHRRLRGVGNDARAPLRGDRLRQQPLGRLRAPPRRHHHQHAAEVRDDVDADDLRAARSCRNRSCRSRWTRSRRGSTW